MRACVRACVHVCVGGCGWVCFLTGRRPSRSDAGTKHVKVWISMAQFESAAVRLTAIFSLATHFLIHI